VFELVGVVPDNNILAHTMLVDGRLVPAAILSAGIGIGGYVTGSIRMNFGSRAVRDIWIETALQSAYFRFDAGDLVLPPSGDAGPQITFVGDSYLQTTSVAFPNGFSIALETGMRLGLRNIAGDAIGSTGYYASNGLGNLNDRLASHALDASQIYVVMAGINDYADNFNGQLIWPTQPEYETAVSGYFARLRAARPDALIVATAPFCPIPPMSDASYVGNTASNGSGVGDFLFKASLQKSALQAIPGPWVYIDVLMGSGWLNSSGATGDVTNLQWFTGGTPGPGTSATYRPGNTHGGGGGGFGGIESIPVVQGGRYSRAPQVTARGGSGQGLLLMSSLNSDGTLRSIYPVCPGNGYGAGPALPVIEIDRTYETAPAQLGTPVLMVGTNPAGQYPLASFAPAGATDLNNIFRLMSRDTVHPSHLGVEYIAQRLARNIHDAVMAL
jgi:lysophospholipase L1-like esterase